MYPFNRLNHLNNCHGHFLKRALQHKIKIQKGDLPRIEFACEKARPAYEKPDQNRYWIRFNLNGQRFRVIYDTDLECLVTIWPLKKKASGKRYGR